VFDKKLTILLSLSQTLLTLLAGLLMYELVISELTVVWETDCVASERGTRYSVGPGADSGVHAVSPQV